MKGRSRAYAIADPYRAPSRRWRSPSTTTATPSLPRPWSPTISPRRSNPALSISSTARPSCTGPNSRLVCNDGRSVLFQGKNKDLAGIDTIRIPDSVPVRPVDERVSGTLAVGLTADAPQAVAAGHGRGGFPRRDGGGQWASVRPSRGGRNGGVLLLRKLQDRLRGLRRWRRPGGLTGRGTVRRRCPCSIGRQFRVRLDRAGTGRRLGQRDRHALLGQRLLAVRLAGPQRKRVVPGWEAGEGS